MKAQVFLELVGEMLRTQQDYFKAKREGLVKAKDLLIASKDLEKRVFAVVKEGRLEPDVPAVEVFNEAEYQERLRFFEELKLLAKQRPDYVEGEPVDETTN